MSRFRFPIFGRGKQEAIPQTDLDCGQEDCGDAEEQFELGNQYALGVGRVADQKLAVECYRKAAMRNHGPAQFALGKLLLEQCQMPEDKANGLAWVRRAADQGHAGAQHQLGLSCRRASFGEITGKLGEAKVEAFKWFRLAAAQGHVGSDRELGSVTLVMSPEEVAEGNRRFLDFAKAPWNSATD